jgi:hypothetical protein
MIYTLLSVKHVFNNAVYALTNYALSINLIKMGYHPFFNNYTNVLTNQSTVSFTTLAALGLSFSNTLKV